MLGINFKNQHGLGPHIYFMYLEKLINMHIGQHEVGKLIKKEKQCRRFIVANRQG